MSAVALKTERLVLRAPVPGDLERCALLLGDYEVAKMLSRVSHPYDLERGRAYLETCAREWQTPEEAEELAFQIDHEGEMIGCFAFKKLRDTPEIGYWLGRAYWGKGFMTEAARAALGWLFDNTAHARVACEAMTDNPGSFKVAEKLGFRTVGEVSCASLSRGGSMPALRTEVTREDFLNGH